MRRTTLDHATDIGLDLDFQLDGPKSSESIGDLTVSAEGAATLDRRGRVPAAGSASIHSAVAGWTLPLRLSFRSAILIVGEGRTLVLGGEILGDGGRRAGVPGGLRGTSAPPLAPPTIDSTVWPVPAMAPASSPGREQA